MTKKKKPKSTPWKTIKARQPIADGLIKKMRGYLNAGVVDLSAARAGKERAEALQETVASREALSKLHPAHAIYVYAQNQTSVMVEQLTQLAEMDRFTRLLGRAEDTYMPSGPPMSPLTHSFFSSWAYFDACVGLGKETVATVAMAVGKTFGMHDELLRVIGLLQQSRMSIQVHEGYKGDSLMFRELVTGKRCRAHCPAGYDGRPGELWYARVLPPPVDGLEEHVVFTTPYVLAAPGEQEWNAYFSRTLPDGDHETRVAAYERHMKWGPTREYWTEFVFEAYLNYQKEVIFLRGLPDLPESRPHSEVNS